MCSNLMFGFEQSGKIFEIGRSKANLYNHREMRQLGVHVCLVTAVVPIYRRLAKHVIISLKVIAFRILFWSINTVSK